MPYLFGDNERAIRRLDLLARVFRPGTETLLRGHRERHSLGPDAVILDLGCGPGRTTRLLADVFGARVTGLDMSPALLWEARRLGPDRVRFLHCDVSHDTLPTPHADLVFARLLLTHLPDPAKHVQDWSRALKSAGCLLVEEVDQILVENEIFRRYLEVVEKALERQGGQLYIGGDLSELGDLPSAPMIRDEVEELEVLDSNAAGMFALNLPNLAQTKEVRAFAAPDVLEALQGELETIAYSASSESSITWRLRHVCWQSTG